MKYVEIIRLDKKETLGRIILDKGEIRFENVPEDLQKHLEYGIYVPVGEGPRRVYPNREPELFFEKLPFEFKGGYDLISEVKNG